MYRIDGPDNVAVLPTPSALGTPGYFRKADTGTSTRGTVVTTDWLNAVQEEIANAIEATGGILSKTSNNQLATALGNISEVAGLKSDISDTGVSSTTHTNTLLGCIASQANGLNASVVASNVCLVSGTQAAAIACNGLAVTGTNAFAAGSSAGVVAGVQCAVIGSTSCQIVSGAGTERVIAASDTCTIAATNSTACILSSASCDIASADYSFIAASLSSDTSGAANTVVIGATGGSLAGAVASSVIGAENGLANSPSSMVAVSKRASTIAGGAYLLTIASEGQALGGADCSNAGTHSAIVGCYGSTASPTTIGASAVRSLAAACDSVSVAQGTDIAAVACGNVTINTTNGRSWICASNGGIIGGISEAGAIVACARVTTAIPTISGGEAVALIACRGAVTANGNASAAITSQKGTGSVGPLASGSGATIIGCTGDLTVSGSSTLVVASDFGTGAITVANTRSICGGTSGGQTWRIESDSGDIYSDGTIGAGTADYAECFENLELGTIPRGAIVTLAKGRVAIAGVGDRILGVVSVAPATLANSAPLGWHDRYLRDEMGAPLCDEDGRALINPKYDSAMSYVPRDKRPEEWTAVGLLGQIRVLVDASVEPGGFVVPGKQGLGMHANEPGAGKAIQCMQVVSAYGSERGYGIALCYVG